MERELVVFGSGNVFEDLGAPEAGQHLARADLVSKIACVIENRSLSQAEVARITGISEPEVAVLLKGRCRDFSAEHLDRILQRLKVAVA